MASRYVKTFFDEKRPWSVYKDSVLSYYLKPYLAKVAKIGKPIRIVDMFAGRGRFKDGQLGSPLLIADQLKPLADKGKDVGLICIEDDDDHFPVLQEQVGAYGFAEARRGDCMARIDELSALSQSCTTLLYVDPCDVAQLELSRLAEVYRRVQTHHSSVEVILVFMARAFLRQACAVVSGEQKLKAYFRSDPMFRDAPEEDWGQWSELFHLEDDDPRPDKILRAAAELERVAGGDYWRAIAEDRSRPWGERLQLLVEAYQATMRAWFDLVESFPIHATTGDPHPKYWLVFGTRYQPAIDLFNRAACNARRTQGIAFRNDAGSLFAGIDIATAADHAFVDAELRHLRRQGQRTVWQSLRWAVCRGRNIGRFTDSEINDAIKRAIKKGNLVGSSGGAVDDAAVLKWQ